MNKTKKHILDAPKMGFFQLLMLIIGSMLGAGILVVSSSILPYGFNGVLGWVLSGICSLILGMIFAYNAISNTTQQESPSMAFANSYGKLGGFLVGTTQWLYLSIASSRVIMTFVEYFSHIVHVDSELMKFGISVAIIFLFLILHSFTKSAMKVLSGLTAFKILFFGAIAACGWITFDLKTIFNLPDADYTNNFMNDLYATLKTVSFLEICKSASKALFAFAGLESATADPSAVKNPIRNIPLATFFGITIAGGIFISIHILCANILTYQSTSSAPVKAAMEIVASHHFGSQTVMITGYLVGFIAMLSCLGTVMAILRAAPNVLSDSLIIMDESYSAKIRRTQATDLPLMPAMFTGLFCTVVLMVLYIILPSFLDTAMGILSYFILFVYISPVLVSFKQNRLKPFKFMINCVGLFACFILFVGCNMMSILIGIGIHAFIACMFIMIKRSKIKNKLDNFV